MQKWVFYACDDAGCSFLSETLKVSCSNWAAAYKSLAALLSRQNHEAAPPLLHKELFACFFQISCCSQGREHARCRDQQHPLRWAQLPERWSPFLFKDYK